MQQSMVRLRCFHGRSCCRAQHLPRHDVDMDVDRTPPLWTNTAQVLAGIPDWREAAKEAAVWPMVKGILAMQQNEE